jgi:hypothetical protein
VDYIGSDTEVSAGDDDDQLTATALPLASAVEDVKSVNRDRAHPSPASPGAQARLHWRSLSDGVLFSYLTAAPALFAAFILRDQRERIWVVLLPIAGAGFLIGGAIAGRHRRLARDARVQGEICGLLTVTVVVVANAIRTAALGNGISPRTLALWVSVEVVSVFVAAVGGRLGRRLYLRSRRRKAMLK